MYFVQNFLKLLSSSGILIIMMIGCAQPVVIPDNLVQPLARQKIKVTPPKALSRFQTTFSDIEESYQLGASDRITIEVWGYTELSGAHIIGPDGKITLPLVGPVRLANLSREQAARTVTKKFGQFYTNLAVTVRVDQYASNRVLVLGRVVRPGEIQFGMTAPTLLEAISKAGGFDKASGLQGEAQSLPFTRCAVFRGRDKIVWLELEPLLTGKDLSLNLKLKRNDVVYIPDIEEKLVYVLGEVHSPGAFRLTNNMSFLEALARAGGPTRDAAPGRINVIRPSENINQEIGLSDLIEPNKKVNVALAEGDIIYVPTNTIAKINYAVRFLTPFSTMLGIYADIESIRADKQQRHLDKEEELLRAEQTIIETEREATTGLE